MLLALLAYYMWAWWSSSLTRAVFEDAQDQGMIDGAYHEPISFDPRQQASLEETCLLAAGLGAMLPSNDNSFLSGLRPS